MGQRTGILDGNGQRIEVEFVSNVYEAGEQRVIQCNIRDITQRKWAEDALPKAGALQNAIFNSANFSSIATDARGVIQLFNVGAERMLGYAAADVMNKITPADISDPQEVIARAKALSAELATPITPGFEALVFKASRGIEDIYELTYIRKDGSRFPAVVSVTALRDEQDGIIGYLLIGTDNTARKQAADEAVAHLAAIVQCSEDAIIGKDLRGIVTSWNLGAEKAFGYSAREMVGQSIARIIPPECQQEEAEILGRILRGENVLHFETARLRKDGSRIEVSLAVSAIKDSAGKLVGASKVARDITERKQAQEKIRQLNIELERRVAERTAQLEAANKELESFSYSVSHDLRAPLRHVMGFANLLQKEAGPSLSEEGLSHLTTIFQAAERMGELIDDLLAFSRAGRVALQKTGVNLNELVRETLGGFQAETKERNIVWQIHPLPEVRADHNLLRQVLANLIANAVKFTGARARAKIEIGCAPEANGETVIFVRDNGAGFDPKYASKLFGVFQRLHSASEFEGTGIGLANVQRIIRRHGGRTWAEGVVNGGATFYFSIPKQKEA
jgi:PAS domain S-box-containing protein